MPSLFQAICGFLGAGHDAGCFVPSLFQAIYGFLGGGHDAGCFLYPLCFRQYMGFLVVGMMLGVFCTLCFRQYLGLLVLVALI